MTGKGSYANVGVDKEVRLASREAFDWKLGQLAEISIEARIGSPLRGVAVAVVREIVEKVRR